MLKSIYIKGFKSFCNPVILDINAPVIVFIGPNGCGKSNIFDAFLWILAEQSIKKLRGDNAQDLIFNGTKNKGPSSIAEVTLEIMAGNESGEEQMPLTITRRIFRNDTSQFILNEKNTRLFYIKEKLSEYNLDITPFSFISQGNVENLLNKKPAELRELFEDVAGIHKYKKIIQEYNLSIEQKHFEFSVLNEKKSEITERLEILRVQSQKAQKYQLLYQEKQKLYRESLILKFRLYFEKVTAHKTSKIQLDMEFKESEEQLETLQGKKLSLGRDLDNIVQKLKLIDREINLRIKKDMELKSGKQVLNEKIDMNEKETERLESEIEIIEKQNEELKYKIQHDIENIKLLSSRSGDLKRDSEAIKDKHSHLDAIYNEGKNQYNELNEEIKKLADGIASIKQDVTNREKELIKLQSSLNNSESLIDRETNYLEELMTEKNSCLDAMESSEKLSKKLNRECTRISGMIAKEEEKDKNTGRLIQDKRNRLISCRSKLNTLQSLLEKIKGDTEKNIGKIFSRTEGCLGLFYEIFEFDEGDARYIDSRLGIFSKSLVFKNNKSMLYFAGSFSQNSENSVCLTSLELLKGTKGTKIKYRNEEYFLPFTISGDIRIEDNTDFINDRILFIRPFAVCNPLKMSSDSAISHVRDIRQLEKDAINIEKEEREALDKQEKIKLQLDNLKKQHFDIKSRLEEGLRIISVSRSRLESLVSAESKVKKQIKDMNEECLSNKEQIKKLTGIFGRDQEALNKKEEKHRILLSRLDTKKLEEETLLIELNNSASRLQEIEYESKTLKNEIEFLSKGIAASRDTMAGNIKSHESIQQRIGDIQELVLSLREQLVFFHNEQSLVKKKISQIGEEKKSFMKQKACAQKELDYIADLIEKQKEKSRDLHESLHRIEISHEKDKTILDMTKNEFIDKGYHEDDLYSYELDIKINDAAYDGYRSRLKNIDIRLSDLGEINPLAIREYDRENAKYQDYLTQIEDISSAIKELGQLIKKTNAEALDRYHNTIYTIEKNFKNIFKKLFNGGSAQINLLANENTDDDLPIPFPDILITPPGKNISKINLLSGGEKALSALALIFSLFMYRPSPFCFLDEVDASLDEINTVKFVELVKEFSKNTQFFIITHNRKTMTIGDYIYGITSEEKGISKVLSISFES